MVTLTNLIVWRVHVGANSLKKLEGPDMVRPGGLVGWRFTLIRKKRVGKATANFVGRATRGGLAAAVEKLPAIK